MADTRDLVPAAQRAVGRLDRTTKKKAAAIAQSIDEVKRDAQRIKQVSRQELEEVAEKYARAPSTFLAGVVGGALGAAGGVLTFRGRNYWRLERTTQKTKGAIDFIRAELNGLPADAPPEVRKELYEQYRSLLAEYSRIARDSIDDSPELGNYAQGAS
jgi:hypothetical protein